MTNSEEQRLIHGISGIAQSVTALSTLFKEISLQRDKTDQEILGVLKLMSRKH